MVSYAGPFTSQPEIQRSHAQLPNLFTHFRILLYHFYILVGSFLLQNSASPCLETFGDWRLEKEVGISHELRARVVKRAGQGIHPAQ